MRVACDQRKEMRAQSCVLLCMMQHLGEQNTQCSSESRHRLVVVFRLASTADPVIRRPEGDADPDDGSMKCVDVNCVSIAVASLAHMVLRSFLWVWQSVVLVPCGDWRKRFCRQRWATGTQVTAGKHPTHNSLPMSPTTFPHLLFVHIHNNSLSASMGCTMCRACPQINRLDAWNATAGQDPPMVVDMQLLDMRLRLVDTRLLDTRLRVTGDMPLQDLRTGEAMQLRDLDMEALHMEAMDRHMEATELRDQRCIRPQVRASLTPCSFTRRSFTQSNLFSVFPLWLTASSNLLCIFLCLCCRFPFPETMRPGPTNLLGLWRCESIYSHSSLVLHSRLRRAGDLPLERGWQGSFGDWIPISSTGSGYHGGSVAPPTYGRGDGEAPGVAGTSYKVPKGARLVPCLRLHRSTAGYWRKGRCSCSGPGAQRTIKQKEGEQRNENLVH